MTIRIKGMAGLLRIFCAVLLLSLGVGHKPVSAQPALDSTNSAFVLPDGSFALLCSASAGAGEPEKSGWHGCDTCLIVSGALLPLPSGGHTPADGIFVTIDFALRTALLVQHVARPGSPVRGPPSVLV